MGIRVVQRAMAPPSPHQYVPGGATNRRQAPGSAQSLGDARGSKAAVPKMIRQASQATSPETGRPTVNGSVGGSNNSTPCKIQKDPPSEGACSDNEVSYAITLFQEKSEVRPLIIPLVLKYTLFLVQSFTSLMQKCTKYIKAFVIYLFFCYRVVKQNIFMHPHLLMSIPFQIFPLLMLPLTNLSYSLMEEYVWKHLWTKPYIRMENR